MVMFRCIKQHLSNIWSTIHEKVKQHEGELKKKALLIEKACNFMINETMGGSFLFLLFYFIVNLSSKYIVYPSSKVQSLSRNCLKSRLF